MRKIVEDANRLADMINQIELIRKQLRDLKDELAGTNDARTIVEAADELERKLIGVEEHLLRMKSTGSGQDFLREPPQLAEKLGYLHDQVDWDFAPTIQQAEVHRMLREQVANHRSQLDEVLGRELVTFNRLLRERNPSTRTIDSEELRPVEQIEVEVAEDILETYVGEYAVSSAVSMVVTLEGGALFVQGYPVFAESDTTFFLRVFNALISFTKDDSGEVTGIILHQNGRNEPGRKVR